MNIQTKKSDLHTGIKDEESVAGALASVLSDTYRLLIKTHVYHWNVEGPTFYSIHQLTEDQYQDLFEATDEIAERIRALGEKTPSKISGITDGSVIGETVDPTDAEALVSDLAKDHERIAHRFHALIKLSGHQGDPVTEDMATARSAFHEKAAWMLRAIVS
ncbi:DNA starvation/stationary phase protection protein [Marivivens niveibacter]|uniref:DNA starvation/stationary phase protection protein n=1 Tax=Marivivens niveibacter TaxID=1930667 RepID=A0A251WV90_9RHOB|nr:DNA starvation/stationary phase protection protein [Marivivens niveibacter]OUD08171.1 DNA starvation/stationary phase protection protein [Marivivens niveibacter]